MNLPPNILERVQRLLEYHESSKRIGPPVPPAEPAPSVYRVFSSLPATPLPTTLLDANIGTMELLQQGLEAMPESQMQPPQDLKTLASWLYMAYGLAVRPTPHSPWIRSCFSDSGMYPCEIYVAAMAVRGLEPGLYHYSVRDFALHRMRDGDQTARHIARGRPDLRFLRTVPAVLLVSTVYSRATWMYGPRAYRDVLLDAGHLIQNLVTVATGLGIRNLVRLVMSDNAMRDLIGLQPDPEFVDAESVHAMIVWADATDAAYIVESRRQTAHPESAPASPLALSIPAVESLCPIARPPPVHEPIAYSSILAVHHDCVAPGMAMRELRPPLTESSPLGPDYPVHDLAPLSGPPAGLPLRQVLRSRVTAETLDRRQIQRDLFYAMNRVMFRGGTFYPMFPDGPHVALVRPLWILSTITGMDAGIWYYSPSRDTWAALRYGNLRVDVHRLFDQRDAFTNSAAICVMLVLLRPLLVNGGPDIYRLAHIEAGAVGQRLILAAGSAGLACSLSMDFPEQEVRLFLGLEKTGWEPLYAAALGGSPFQIHRAVQVVSEPVPWRG